MADPSKKMGSGIIMLPASMAQLGAVSLLSWVITAVGSMAIAYCFAQCGIFCTRTGGMSAYSAYAQVIRNEAPPHSESSTSTCPPCH